MKFADSVKQAASLTSTATITLGAAATGFRTLAQAITDTAGKPEQVAVGDIICMRVEDAADASKWEISTYTITAPGTLTRQSIVSSSAAGAAVTFGGAVSVLCTVPSSHLARTCADTYPSFSQSVPLTQPGTAWMPQYTVTGALAFTPAAGAVRGAFANIPFVHDGASAITFPGFTKHSSSMDFVGGAGMPWTAYCWYDGVKYWYQLSQAADPVAIDTTAPTAASAAVANGTPTIVTITASEALDPNYTPAASAFTVAGHTVSGVAVAGSAVNLTVSAAFANGEAARTVTYTQPGAAGLRDQAGNLMASFSALAITNNVQPVDVTPPTVSSAQVANASSTVIQITMSEALAASNPPASAFAVSGGKTVSSVSISGAVVSLTCSAAYANGDTITATYTAPATNPRLQDAAGNATASFGPVGVTNNVAVTAPAGNYLRLTTLDHLTETGTGPYTYQLVNSGGTFGTQGGVSAQVRPTGADASAIVINNANPVLCEMIVGVTNAANAAFAAMDYAIWTGNGASSFYTPITGGNIGSATAVAKAAGDSIRTSFVGTTLVIEVARSATPATWIPVYTFTGVSTASRKFAVNIAAGSNFQTSTSVGLA